MKENGVFFPSLECDKFLNDVIWEQIFVEM